MANDPFNLHDGIVALWDTRNEDASAYFSTDLSQPFYALHYAEVAFQSALLVESSESEKEAIARLVEAEAKIKEQMNAQSWVRFQ